MGNKPRVTRRIPVLVTTAHRGVFFGYAVPGEVDDEILSITSARNCVYWSADVKGFLGLAKNGPTSGCRIGPAANELRLRNVTGVAKVTAEAAAKWEAHPWI